MKVKICGLKSEADIEAVNEYKPDYVGFVLCKRSKRFVTYERAQELMKLLDPSIQTVGVFLENDLDEIKSCTAFDFIQMHGYTEEEVREIKMPTIRAISVKSEADMIEAKNSKATFVLLDNGLGGTGKTFDWSLISLERDFFLAGGLNADMALPNVYALDVSSGVETDGKKDKNKIKRFIETVRSKT